MNIHQESSTEDRPGDSTKPNTIQRPERPNEPRKSAGEGGRGARARWIWLVGSCSFGSLPAPLQLMTRNEGAFENACVIDGL